MIYDGLPPRHVAAAIASLGADRVRRAWRYLDSWAALERAGVPRTALRDVMAEPRETGPLSTVTAWAERGSRGLLALCGAPGTGKTYAAARWTVLRHLQGQPTTWVSVAALSVMSERERRARLEAVADRAALVIDDVGAGATNGDWLKDQLQGVLQHRMDGLGPRGLVPTVLVTNGSEDELRLWAGPRVCDRAKLAGGFAQVISRTSLRKTVDDIDGWGRDRVWYRAHRLVDTIGCEQVERYDDDGRRRVDLDVGRKLDAAARRLGYEACEAAEQLLGLTRPAVEVEARRLRDVELDMVRAVSDRFGVEVHGAALSFESIAAALAGQVRQREAEARERQRAEALAVVGRARRYEHAADPIDSRPVPEWARGKAGRKALRKLGFCVVEVGERYQVRRKLGSTETILATGATSDNAAWEYAAKLCAEVDTRIGAGE